MQKLFRVHQGIQCTRCTIQQRRWCDQRWFAIQFAMVIQGIATAIVLSSPSCDSWCPVYILYELVIGIWISIIKTKLLKDSAGLLAFSYVFILIFVWSIYLLELLCSAGVGWVLLLLLLFSMIEMQDAIWCNRSSIISSFIICPLSTSTHRHIDTSIAEDCRCVINYQRLDISCSFICIPVKY